MSSNNTNIVSYPELREDTIGQMAVPKKVDKVATTILQSNDATSPERALQTAEIIEHYREMQEQDNEIVNINANSFATTLSFLAHDSESQILCDGRKQGYYVKPQCECVGSAEDADAENGTEDNTEKNADTQYCTGIKKTVLEKDLYESFKNWLRMKGYYAQNVANKRAMDKWQNTDIVGIKDTYILDLPHIEIAAIEVKRSKSNWHVDIFEAVAHKMFAHRVYFAFLCTENEVDKIGEMAQYAERYKIGILALVVPEEYEDIESALNSAYVREIVPAPYDAPSIEMQKTFLEGTLGITTREKLNRLKYLNAN